MPMARKHIDRILVVPTRDGVKTHGNEYMQLYRRIDMSDIGQLAVWQPGDSQHGVVVRNL